MNTKTVLTILSIGIILVMASGCISAAPQNNPLPGEVVNMTVTVQPNDREVFAIPLPGSGTYEIFAKTTGRGMSAVVAYSYFYWENTSSTDKFGTVWNNRTRRNAWSSWYSGGGLHGNLGKTDDTSDIDRIFVISPEQMSPSILIASSDVHRDHTTKSIVHIRVISTTLPKAPLPPDIGSIVKCSNYSDRNTAQQWGSSDGSSWLDAFGSSDHSLSITDKYTTYVFPINLTVINQDTDTCKVQP